MGKQSALINSANSTLESSFSLAKTFDKGPKVALHIERTAGKITSTRLSLSKQFVCTGADSAWIEEYLQGKHPLIDLEVEGTFFLKEVLATLQQIPFGTTISYGKLAELAGYPKAARAVGNVCNKNPFPFFIPCHRVIHSNGNIGGFAMDLEIKSRLLNWERQAFHLPQS